MKATIIDTHHCIEIEGNQLDLFYNFINNTIQVYINGDHYISSTFHPGRVILSYTNVLQVGTTFYDHYITAKNKATKLMQKELEADVHINNI